MRKHVFLLSIFIILILLSCRSFDNNEDNSYVLSEILIGDVRELLENGKYLEAFQNIDFLNRSGKITYTEFQELNTSAIEGIKSEYENSLNEDSSLDILRYYLTLKNILNDGYPDNISEKEIMLKIAREQKEKNNSVAAVILYLRILKREDSGYEDFIEAADFVYEIKDSASMRIITDLMKIRGLEINPQYLEIINNVPTKSEMMLATATVWVDKGTTYEDGIGYPNRALGSGFFIDRRGFLLTNYHVIQSEVDPEYEGFSRLYIKLPNRVEERIPAKVIAWDPVFDIALIKVEIEPKYIFNIAADISVEPGDKVYVIGSPLDPLLENTITSGIISATSRRHFLQMGDVIQVDAPVNPGNSGGPLLSETGELIGIIFAGIKPYEGLNFAIPSKWVRLVLDNLYNEGIIKHKWLGMIINETDGGLEVIYTVPGESADTAGIDEGDILVSINNIKMNSIIDIQEYLLKIPADSIVTVQWRHDDIDVSGFLVLKERPEFPMELALDRDTKANIIYPLFGMKLKEVEISRWEKRYVVEDIILGSSADNSGISIDDPITLKEWIVDEENRIVFLQIYIRKRTEGYINSAMQIAAFLELDSFI